MTIRLRDYQAEALDALYGYFMGNPGNPLLALPTGAGKSVVIAEFIRRSLELYPDTRILCLTHVKELIAQNHAELMGLWPRAPAGIYSAGLRKRQIDAQVLFAGVQSVWNKAYQLQRVDLVLIDECHLIPRRGDTTYRRLLADLKVINPYVKVVGFTATPFRLDSGMLTDGEDAVFSDVAYDANIRDLMDQGYLSPLVSQGGASSINTAGVGTRGGEFVAGALEAAACDPDTVERIADEVVAAGHDRRGWIVFGCGVKHCGMLRDAVRARGFSCESIFGDTPEAERADILERFRRQEIRCLSSMNVLTTGFNARHVDLVAVARPTKSTGLWIQICGRGTRLFDGKLDCLVLDFGGNIERHGPIDRPKVKTPNKDGGGEVPTKECPNCQASVLIAARECPECGHEFEFEGAKVATKASTLSVMSAPPPPPEWLAVSDVSYSRHEKNGKTPSLKVRYRCGMVWHSEWVCLEHTGYARSKAAQWWRRRWQGTDSDAPAPTTVDDALALASRHFLDQPSRILVKQAGKYPEIVGHDFAPIARQAEEFLPEDFAA